MTDFQTEKALVRALYDAIDAASADGVAQAIAPFYAPDALFRAYHPVNEQRGAAAMAAAFWHPLKSGLSALHRRLDMFIAGANTQQAGGVWVASMGHMMGLFDAPLWGIRPTRKIGMLRYATFHRVENGQIVDEALFFDLPHLMIQAGQNPFPPATGAHLVQPGPLPHDALRFAPTDPAEGIATQAAIDFMCSDIAAWSGGNTEALADELRRSWHEDMIWWGPAGIGATYTIPRYAEQHSGPFRTHFKQRRFHGHVCRISEGHYGGFFGWPNLSVQNHGGFMGMPASADFAPMRVIDLYRRKGDKLAENWIFIDMLNFYNQQGLDILGRNQTILSPL